MRPVDLAFSDLVKFLLLSKQSPSKQKKDLYYFINMLYKFSIHTKVLKCLHTVLWIIIIKFQQVYKIISYFS